MNYRSNDNSNQHYHDEYQQDNINWNDNWNSNTNFNTYYQYANNASYSNTPQQHQEHLPSSAYAAPRWDTHNPTSAQDTASYHSRSDRAYAYDQQSSPQYNETHQLNQLLAQVHELKQTVSELQETIEEQNQKIQDQEQLTADLKKDVKNFREGPVSRANEYSVKVAKMIGYYKRIQKEFPLAFAEIQRHLKSQDSDIVRLEKRVEKLPDKVLSAISPTITAVDWMLGVEDNKDEEDQNKTPDEASDSSECQGDKPSH